MLSLSRKWTVLSKFIKKMSFYFLYYNFFLNYNHLNDFLVTREDANTVLKNMLSLATAAAVEKSYLI